MDLKTAESLVQSYLKRIDAIYLRKLFDEWALLSLSPTGEKTVVYQGPRRDAFAAQLGQDTRQLRAAMNQKTYQVGDFEFALEAQGPGYDACIIAGESAYLVFNNLALTLDEMRKDPLWLKVQPLWLELAQAFQADPLV